MYQARLDCERRLAPSAGRTRILGQSTHVRLIVALTSQVGVPGR
jgi:hypothetical protein